MNKKAYEVIWWPLPIWVKNLVYCEGLRSLVQYIIYVMLNIFLCKMKNYALFQKQLKVS